MGTSCYRDDHPVTIYTMYPSYKMLSCLKDSHSPSLGAPGELSSQEVSGVRGGGGGSKEGGEEGGQKTSKQAS